MDRNRACITTTIICTASLSARRAWIEIKSGLQPLIASLVALRKESVDRNSDKDADWVRVYVSLSARRAWIEISSVLILSSPYMSLSARRAWIEINDSLDSILAGVSLSARRAWIEIVDVVSVQHGCESLSARRAWIEIKSSWQRFCKIPSRSPQGERG